MNPCVGDLYLYEFMPEKRPTGFYGRHSFWFIVNITDYSILYYETSNEIFGELHRCSLSWFILLVNKQLALRKIQKIS